MPFCVVVANGGALGVRPGSLGAAAGLAGSGAGFAHDAASAIGTATVIAARRVFLTASAAARIEEMVRIGCSLQWRRAAAARARRDSQECKIRSIAGAAFRSPWSIRESQNQISMQY